jgi:hypothetical protein
MRPGPSRRLLGPLVVLLVALATVQAADASIRIVFRFTVLSWDNPATQLFDELICESSPPSQAGAEAGQFTRLGARASGRLFADSVLRDGQSPALSSGITRAPPAA